MEKRQEMVQGGPYRFRATARELQLVRLETMEKMVYSAVQLWAVAMFGSMS